jgi:hypothetical protein
MNNTSIHNFLTQSTAETSTDDGLDLTALYGLYVSWSLTNGHEPMSNGSFVTALRHYGLEHDDNRGSVRFYPGITMLDTSSTLATPANPLKVDLTVGEPITDEPDALPV